MRWDIINHLIKKVDGKRYLEIGYYKGWSFNEVRAERKIAVDPNPSRFQHEESLAYGEEYSWGSSDFVATVIKETSDDFFKYQSEHPETYDGPWDVIFIDGLHESEQVKRDIENAIKHLAPGGYIVLHDMNPPLEEHTKGGIDGCWTGDCYKAVLTSVRHYNFHTVDTDWGVGVLQPFPIGRGDFMSLQGTIVDFGREYEKARTDWNYFDQNRKELMNIISVEEFLKTY